MENFPLSLTNMAALGLLLIGVGGGAGLLTETSIISVQNSSIICLPGNATYNETFVNGISAGVFTRLENSDSRLACVRRSCEQRGGDVAFMFDGNCYMVRCHADCEVRPTQIPMIHSVSVTPYTWFDAAPKFVGMSDVVEMRENNDPGHIVMDIYANARSRWHRNATVTFGILAGNRGGAFRLQPGPEGHSTSLLATKSLDREAISSHNLTLLARNTEENKTASYFIKIVVLDENDNGPVFPKRMRQTIFSNASVGTDVYRVRTVDADTAENAQVQYYLQNFHYLFRLLPSGVLQLKQKIGIDKSSTFSVIFAARNGPHRVEGQLDLLVVAVNEFRPEFEELSYEAKVSEAVPPGTSVLRITALDADAGEFGALNYTAVGGNTSIFHIDNEGVIRTSRSLYRLGGRTCTLLLSVCDRGNPPKRARSEAVVRINIVRTEKLTFDLPRYHVALLENTPERSEILRVHAVAGYSFDSSLPEERTQGPSGDVMYAIVNEEMRGKFFVESKTGRIITLAPLDYEKKREYRLIIMATNKQSEGKKATTDTTTVIVQLLDVNDNAPLFVLREYEQVIRENKSVDTAILRVTATDRDSGSNSDLQYDITQGNTNKSFSIDNNGVIRLRAGLLGQSIKLFNLTVVATDKGSPRLSSRPTFVYIRVRRRTDPTGPPTLFPAIYRTSINESFPVGGRVLRVRVRTDRPAEQISYRLFNNVMPDVNEHFRVEHRTGIISLTKSLDYEAKKAYSFYVGAHDSRTRVIFDTVLVRIYVTDVNDNHPVFVKREYNVVAESKVTPGSTILRVTATDKDSGENSNLRFRIQSGSRRFFRVLPSGSVEAVRSLERENLRLFNLTVSVSDNGSESLTADHKAHISLLLFQPFQVPVIFLKATESTISLRFNLKYLRKRNVAKYGVIVQEYAPEEHGFDEHSKLEPLTWNLVYGGGQEKKTRRFITTMIQSNPAIEKKGELDVVIGTENCAGKTNVCNGPLRSGIKYRFQLQAFVKYRGPFTNRIAKDSEYTEAFYTEMPAAASVGASEGGSNYDAVVYSVGTGLVVVIVLAFLRGFYRLKLDRKRIHEEKKGQISFPVSNPRFARPDSPLEKIRTPGPARKLVAVNQDKEFSRQDEDDGSSPDSALGTCPSCQSEPAPPQDYKTSYYTFDI